MPQDHVLTAIAALEIELDHANTDNQALREKCEELIAAVVQCCDLDIDANTILAESTIALSDWLDNHA